MYGLRPGLSGFETMCMVKAYEQYIKAYYSINDRNSSTCTNPFKVGETDMVWLQCLAVLVASPQNFFTSGRGLKMVHRVVSERLLAGSSS